MCSILRLIHIFPENFHNLLRTARNMGKEPSKQRFPFVMLVVVFIFLLGISAVVTVGYLYFSVKERIAEIVVSTKSYAVPLAESLAGMAALSQKLNDYSALKALVHTKIEESIIDEAFFVLESGTIIAHSRKEVEKELEGNIAQDEFAYNTDLILGPLRENSRDTRIIDYNIIGKNVPFKKYERLLLKKYFYDGIDTTGWLVTKAVYTTQKGKEVSLGTVNFLISKERIYRQIYSLVDYSILLIKILSAASFALAMLISIFVLLRYRKIQRHTGSAELTTKEVEEKSIAVQFDELMVLQKDGLNTQNEEILDEYRIDVTRPVRDAIPVRKRDMRS